MAERQLPAPAVVTDDPLAGIPSIFTVRPESAQEATRRRHIGLYVLTALDRRLPLEDREQAVRHILSCDPARAIGLLIELGGNALAFAEDALGSSPGTAIDEIRAADLAAHPVTRS